MGFRCVAREGPRIAHAQLAVDRIGLIVIAGKIRGLINKEHSYGRAVRKLLAKAQQTEVGACDTVFGITSLHMHGADVSRVADLARKSGTSIDGLRLTVRI